MPIDMREATSGFTCVHPESAAPTLQVLTPTCNPSTVTDGRGGIFTWVPPDPIVEFNLIYYTVGTLRGMHYHSEFIEYILVVGGAGALVHRGLADSEEQRKSIHLSTGMCVRIPPKVVHTIYPLVPMTAVAMLTRAWDDCKEPAVRVGSVRGSGS